MKNILKITLSIFSFLLIYSCQQELEVNDELENINQEINIEEITSKIYVSEDGVLNFTTTEDFKNTILWIKGLSEEETISWNNELGFKSLYSIYLDALDQEALLYEKYGNILENSENQDSKLLNSFKNEFNELKKKYNLHLNFVGYTINNIKTYDKQISKLLDENGVVYVQGSKLEYTENELKIDVNFKNNDNNKKNETQQNDILVFDLSSNGTISKNSEQTLTDRCRTDSYVNGADRRMTGNTSVINTISPVYRRVWVPRVCETICPGLEEIPIEGGNPVIPIDGECYESCTGGYYRNVFVRNDIIGTRVVATIRSYKCVRFFGCEWVWSKKPCQLDIQVGNFFTDFADPGSVSKFSWEREFDGGEIVGDFVEIEYRRIIENEDFDFVCTGNISW